MRLPLLFLFLFLATHVPAQSFNAPESVAYDSASHRYFISNNGANQILARDAAGALTIFTSSISSGPHGLEIAGSTLYACDGGAVKGFDLASGAVVMNLNVGGTFLNGICTDGSNTLYATDFSARKIFKIDIASQSFTVFVTGLVKSPNGIIYDGANQRIIWVTWGSNAPVMQALLSDSTVSQVTATTLGNCDGIVRDGSGRYYVSAWSTQTVYRFDNLFSAAPVAVVTGLNNPADIYYNLADDSLASPNAGNNTVTFHFLGGTTSVEENEGSLFSIYPNPVCNQLIIDQGKWKINSVEIFDAPGKKVYNSDLGSAGNTPLTIDVSHLSPGVYWVRVTSDKKNTSRKLLVSY